MRVKVKTSLDKLKVSYERLTETKMVKTRIHRDTRGAYVRVCDFVSDVWRRLRHLGNRTIKANSRTNRGR